MKKILIPGIALLLLVAGCQPEAVQSLPAVELTVEPAPTNTLVQEVTQALITPTNLPEPTSAPAIPAVKSCTLFPGETQEQLLERLTNPFNPPSSGSDDPHQGVDFSDLDAVTLISKTGLPVHALLAGNVAMVTKDRFPYGHAVLVETRFEQLPQAWQDHISEEVRSDPEATSGNLTCPPRWNEAATGQRTESLYILYAHLLEPPVYEIGQPIGCGDAIGKIGMSGNALNPHVHIEMRIGPAGAEFDSMAHYDVSAASTEMLNYCRWRISGVFSLVDPMNYLFLKP